VPPDWEPGTFPRPKAEDESEAIESWLEATQQPIQDWEWDGSNLRLLLDDGSVETYTREQLDEIGVFGQMAFAEGIQEDDDHKGDEKGEEDEEDREDKEGEESRSGEGPGESGFSFDGEAGPAEPVDSTISGILGNESGEGEIEVIQGEPANQLTQAVDNLVQAILGVVSDKTANAVTLDGTTVGDEEQKTGEMELTEPDERPDENYDPPALAKGVEVEKEHTSNENEAKKIAKDHLDEDSEYYEKLEQVEGQ
jgi:hypothetical protein